MAAKKGAGKAGKSVTALSADQLRWRCDPSSLGFATTQSLEPPGGIGAGLVGQDRALKAIRFGTSIDQPAYNMFVLGAPGTGKTTAVKNFLREKAKLAPSGDGAARHNEWVYVNNFTSPRKPLALNLPAGRGRELREGMIGVIDDLHQGLPAMFESEDYQNRRRAIDDVFRTQQEELIEAVSEKAAQQGIALLQTQSGFVMAPKDEEGKVVKPEVFNEWPENDRKAVEDVVIKLQAELEEVLQQIPRRLKARLKQVRDLNEELAELSVKQALDDLVTRFKDHDGIAKWLGEVHKDLIHNLGLFLIDGMEDAPHDRDGPDMPDHPPQIVNQQVDIARDDRFRSYMVNLLIGSDRAEADGPPIIEELNPTLGNLVGRVEHLAQMGALVTDFLLIKPGALHKANGGYLLLDARKLLMQPLAWEALKRALKNRSIAIESPAEQLSITITQSLDPEPIPLDVKVILFGDPEIYYLLANREPEFPLLFKVQADFDSTIDRSSENTDAYARLIASIIRTDELKPADAGAVARVLEEGARLAQDAEKLSIRVSAIADMLREADFWAGEAGRATISSADVEQAISEQRHRADKMREKSQEQITRDIMLIDTAGDKVGQINGLSVLSLGVFDFGKPTRITARVRIGAGRVTDIEREVELGGPLHSKGVMILWGFLAGRYAETVPLSLAASLVFEQSYGGVDGDSASSTEAYALLSALSNLPIRQGFAVTGSMNQLGEVQAIGGVNEKIEGFFDICRTRGLDGRQGVLIPKANTLHLMLRDDVVEAVRAGQFAIHAVEHIDQGIELLTGVSAGIRGLDGQFPGGSVNALVEQKLIEYARHRHRFHRSDLPFDDDDTPMV